MDIYECEVDLCDNLVKLQDYDNALKKFGQWIQFKREIKLTTLLEGKRVQYDIEEMNTTTPIYGILGEELSGSISIPKISFYVKDMSFIINGDNVESLKIKIKIINGTPQGDLLQSIMDEGLDFKIKQKFLSHTMYFYVDY